MEACRSLVAQLVPCLIQHYLANVSGCFAKKHYFILSRVG